ncbi:MAG: response regulator [Ilyomonas sp.]
MNNHPLNICLVDDDMVYQYVAKKTIESTGLSENIIQLHNGEEALVFFKENVSNEAFLPDIIFLDINMPVMNGWEFLEAYSQLATLMTKDIPVVIVSSSLDDYDLNKSKEFSVVTGFITKPILRDKFIKILSSVYAS